MSRSAVKQKALSIVLSTALLAAGLDIQPQSIFAAPLTPPDLVGPPGSGQFGTQIEVLPNGNLVISDPGYDAGSIQDVGAVYLHDGVTGGLISRITGSSAYDQVGSSIFALNNGSYVISSPYWDSGAVTDVGAVTWCSGTAGCNGVVSTGNSLVGSHRSDYASQQGIIALSTGNYVALSDLWDNGAVIDAGAVTWCSGTTGCTGSISAANSLVGTNQVHLNEGAPVQRFTELRNGNLVVSSVYWDSNPVNDLGAATWCSGTTGCTGMISAANSLVGSRASDYIGVITPLANGNYVVSSPSWSRGSALATGAVTWCNGNTGCAGVISLTNSLVGQYGGDAVGVVTELTNGNYVVRSPDFSGTAGAVTWCSGTSGCIGEVSAANSLVGTQMYDWVGKGGISQLSQGNYLVHSPYWADGAIYGAGAVTWCRGTTGCSGVISSANSLVGSHFDDRIGLLEDSASGVNVLSNGNYVVRSIFWDEDNYDAGAVTWCSGALGCTGVVSSTNSLVGSHSADLVGSHFAELSQGNYVVAAARWDSDTASDVGAVTWCSGAAGCAGVVSAANSLVGSHTSDYVGSDSITGASRYTITKLGNGNYVVQSRTWQNDAVEDAGAVTWCSGTLGCSGVVSTTNSLVGSHTADWVGIEDSITELANGNYVVRSPQWDNGTTTEAGAVTWCNGTLGCAGAISDANSLVGTHTYNSIGAIYRHGWRNGVAVLSNGNYVVGGQCGHVDASATWCDGTIGCTGPVTFTNSLLGGNVITVLANGNYVVRGEYGGRGAVAWANGQTGLTGTISAANSLVGATATDGVGGGFDGPSDQFAITALSDGSYVVDSPNWDNGSHTDAGAVTWGDGNAGVIGVVSDTNSLVGTSANDHLGATGSAAPGIEDLGNGAYIIRSAYWSGFSGALTLAFGGTLTGPLTHWNSAFNVGRGNPSCPFYLGAPDQLVMGCAANNQVLFFPKNSIELSTLAVEPPALYPGKPLTYTVTLVNPRQLVDMANVIVTDTLPAGLSYLPGSLVAPSGNYSYTDGVIQWTGTVPGGQRLTIAFSAMVDLNAAFGTLTNTVEIGQPGASVARSATAEILNPLAASGKSVDPSFALPGSALSYTITLKNDSLFEIAPVVVTDTLPAALSYMPDTLAAPGDSYGYADGVIHWSGTVAASQSLTITYRATVNWPAPGGNLINSVAIGYAGGTITRTAAPNFEFKAYLPFVPHEPCGARICGRVTLNGSPIGGVSLLLRYYDGSAWYTRATTTTRPDGYYAFGNIPALGPGQEYYVRYQNSDATGRLWMWGTRSLTTYAAGSSVDMGVFDIADIALVDPANGASIFLPYTFQWAPRPATPMDSYQFGLWDNDSTLEAYSPLLGYSGSYQLSGLPAGFTTNYYYLWYVTVYSPDGGYGNSYWSRWIKFSNSGLGQGPAPDLLSTQRQQLPDDLVGHPQPEQR